MNQLSFPLAQEAGGELSDIIISSANQDIVSYCMHIDAWSFPIVLLLGAEKSGKSSLLRYWAQQLGADMLPDNPADIMQGGYYVCDDWQPQADEHTSLHRINSIIQKDAKLLCAAKALPEKGHYTVPDLASRMDLVHCLEIAAPDDMLMEALLQKYLTSRQLMASVELVQFLAKRLPRDYAAMFNAVEVLDAAGLDNKRSLTIPFVKEVLGL